MPKMDLESLMMPVFEQFLMDLIQKRREEKRNYLSDDTKITIELLSDDQKYPNARPKVAPIGMV